MSSHIFHIVWVAVQDLGPFVMVYSVDLLKTAIFTVTGNVCLIGCTKEGSHWETSITYIVLVLKLLK
jgi:hypothetical protein